MGYNGDGGCQVNPNVRANLARFVKQAQEQTAVFESAIAEIDELARAVVQANALRDTNLELAKQVEVLRAEANARREDLAKSEDRVKALGAVIETLQARAGERETARGTYVLIRVERLRELEGLERLAKAEVERLKEDLGKAEACKKSWDDVTRVERENTQHLATVRRLDRGRAFLRALSTSQARSPGWLTDQVAHAIKILDGAVTP